MPKSKKPTRRKDDRPLEIIQAAIEVFAEKGFAGARIEEIAKRAGAAKGTVYLYFDTKDKLFEAVVREYISPFLKGTEDMVSDFPGPASELLRKVIERAYSELVSNQQRRAIMRILISEGSRFPQLSQFYYQEILAGAERMLRRIIERGIQRGEFRNAPALDVPQVLMGPAIMAAVWKMTFDTAAPLPLKKFAQAHIDLVLHGLDARRA